MISDIYILRAPKGAVRKKKRLGRGPGSGWGTTAGRGNKGQKARAAGLPGPYLGFEGGQVPLYRRVATRGFSNARYSIKYISVNFSALERVYNDGEEVNWNTLVQKGLIKKGERLVKILAGGGKLTKKISISTSLKMSNTAKQGIESIGGLIT